MFTVYVVLTSCHGNCILVLLVVVANVYALHIILDLLGGSGFLSIWCFSESHQVWSSHDG